MRRLALLLALSLVPPAVFASRQSRDARTVTTGTAEISGTLVLDDTSLAPVRRAILTLRGSDINVSDLTAVTDDGGRFAFTSLPAGRYFLSASKSGYLPSMYGAKRPGGPGTAVVVGGGQRLAGLVMKLLKGSVLSGTVLDDAGRPAPDAIVSAFRYAVSSQTGQRTPQPARFGSSQATTDDLGRYRLYGLEPGEYVVSASWPGQRSGDTDFYLITETDTLRAQQLLKASTGTAGIQSAFGAAVAPRSTAIYAPVYHPSAFRAADATAIAVGPHEERIGIDVLLRLVPTATVRGLVSGKGGTLLRGVGVLLIDPVTLWQSSMVSDRDGGFAFSAIRPGQYTVFAATGMFDLLGRVEVVVEGQDITTAIELSPGVKLSGRMVFEGALAPRPDATAVRFPLSGVGFRELLFRPAQVQLDGAFMFPGVPPGTYRLGVDMPASMQAAGWRLKSAMLKDSDLLDTLLELRPNEDVNGVVVTFSDQHTEISGRMQDASGKPAPEYILIAFSADRRFWVPQSRRTQQIRPGADGQFIIRDLPPGDYLISAVTDVEPGQWNDPAFLADLAPHGIKITLGDGEKKVQDIRVAGR